MKKIFHILLILHSSLLISCAQKNIEAQESYIDDEELYFDFEESHQENNDPLEPFNRAMFAVNDKVYDWTIDPASKAYHWIMPDVAEEGIKSFLKNLQSPVYLFNNILAGEPIDASIVFGRCVIHSLFGFGFLDYVEIPHNVDRSLDDVLEKWGIEKGPFLVLPLLGPSTIRGSTAKLLEAYVGPPGPKNSKLIIPYKSTEMISAWPEKYSGYQEAKKTNFDSYMAIRKWIMDRK